MENDAVDEFLKDETILSSTGSNQQCHTKDPKLQTASEGVIEKPSDYESGPSPKKKWRRKEEASSDESETDASVDEGSSDGQRSTSASSDNSSAEVLCVEREIDILVKLRYSVQIDKDTKKYLSKVLTSVDCDSVNLSSNNRRKNDEGSTTNSATSDAQSCRINVSPSIGSVPDSSNIYSLIDKPEKFPNEEWKNLKLLTTTMMNYTKKKLQEKELEDRLKECVNRPQERIHFSTPEVKEKCLHFIQELNRPDRKPFDSRPVINSWVPNKKRKYNSEIFIKPPEVPEKSCEAEIEATLGPIPAAGSNLFQGKSFVLTCFSRDFIDPHQLKEMEDSENEDQWTRKPFVQERLIAQLKAGGGKIYESFELIPPEKYKTTMHITNIPNLTAKSLLCLSAGIKSYNHQWIIRCCQENKIVNPAEDQLPAGWSLTKQSYVEMFQRPSQRPFSSALPVVVAIPIRPAKQQFVSFWRQICVNAGANVLLVKDSTDNFMEATVVLAHSLCPPWLITKAEEWHIPLVTTRWAIQCLIEGQVCSYDAHPSFQFIVGYEIIG